MASGTATATQFEIIMTSTQLEIDADVNEADISKVSVGQPVTFTVDTYPNQTFTGKIIALSPNATTVSNVQMYETLMSIDNYSKLKSGMPATITIITASATNVILIPESALTYGTTYLASLAKSTGKGTKQTAASSGSAPAGGATTGGTSTGGKSASHGGASTTQGTVVLLVNGQPQTKTVQTGLSDEVNVEVTSGLNVGDTVITGNLTTTQSSTSSPPPVQAPEEEEASYKTRTKIVAKMNLRRRRYVEKVRELQ